LPPLPVIHPVHRALQTRCPTARKIVSRRALPSVFRIEYNQPFALLGSAPARQHSSGLVQRKTIAPASFTPSNLVFNSDAFGAGLGCVRRIDLAPKNPP
jgi:hypothetical protein